MTPPPYNDPNAPVFIDTESEAGSWDRAIHSDGGHEETAKELLQTESENDALLAACIDRRSRIAAAKKGRPA